MDLMVVHSSPVCTAVFPSQYEHPCGYDAVKIETTSRPEYLRTDTNTMADADCVRRSRLSPVAVAVAMWFAAPAMLVATHHLVFRRHEPVGLSVSTYLLGLLVTGPLSGVLAAVGAWVLGRRRVRGGTRRMQRVIGAAYGTATGAFMGLYWALLLRPVDWFHFVLPATLGVAVGVSIALRFVHEWVDGGRRPAWRPFPLIALGMFVAPGLSVIVADLVDIVLGIVTQGVYDFSDLLIVILEVIVIYLDPEAVLYCYSVAALGGLVTGPVAWANANRASSRMLRIASLVYGALVGGIWKIWTASEGFYNVFESSDRLQLGDILSWMAVGIILAFFVVRRARSSSHIDVGHPCR
jgi:hypothetical protein